MIRLVKRFSEKQLEWRNDPQVIKYFRQNEPITEEFHKKWLLEQMWSQSSRYFGIERSETSQVKGFIRKPEIVGYCGISNIPTGDKVGHRTGEYSLLIAPEFKGKGYGKEALGQLLDFAFLTLGLEVVWGEIMETNEAGLKLAESLGFKREGILRCRYLKEGRRISSIMVSLLKQERVGYQLQERPNISELAKIR